MADAEPSYPGDGATAIELKEYFAVIKLLDLKALFKANGKRFWDGWQVKVYLRSGTMMPCNTHYIGPRNTKYSSLKQVKEAYSLKAACARRIRVSTPEAKEKRAAAANQEVSDDGTSDGSEVSDDGSEVSDDGTDLSDDGTEVSDDDLEAPPARPVNQLPKEKFVTGEDEETTLFEEHTKLYRFDSAARQWRLRGKGWAYIKHNPKAFRYRFLFREDATHIVRANHDIAPGLTLTLEDGQSEVRWVCTDFADGHPEMSRFALALDCAELAQRFKDSYTCAMDAVRFRDVDGIPLPDDDKGPTVLEQRLHVLDLEELKTLSYKLGITPFRSKAAVIKALRETKLKYFELTNMTQMKRMLAAEGHSGTGNRAELVKRLIETHAESAAFEADTYEAFGDDARSKEYRHQREAYQQMLAAMEKNAKSELTQVAFRKIMDRHRLLESDMDVCHIIARSHGGANHPDNYHLLGGKFNRKMGRNGDHIMCYIVGLEKAAKAVAVSMKYGNTIYGKYRGKSAEMLFEEGGRDFSKMLMNTALGRDPPGLR